MNPDVESRAYNIFILETRLLPSAVKTNPSPNHLFSPSPFCLETRRTWRHAPPQQCSSTPYLETRSSATDTLLLLLLPRSNPNHLLLLPSTLIASSTFSGTEPTQPHPPELKIYRSKQG